MTEVNNEENKPTIEQENAISYDGKSLLITAGPGAGKTFILIERIKYLLNVKHVDAESILVITFTRKAANQLKEKLSKTKDIGESAVNKMFINTIHSFCIHFLSENGCSDINLLESTSNDERKLMFLRKHKKDLNFTREAYMSGKDLRNVISKFDEYTTFGVESQKLINYIMENRPISQEYHELIASCGDDEEFEFPYDEVKQSKELKESQYNSKYLAIAEAYSKYQELLEEENSYDFNYLQVKVRDIITDDENIAENSRFKNILIDEYQDIDPIQNDIFNILQKYSDTFTVVGDDDQSIYAFRGSVPKYFTDFAESIDKNDPNELVSPLSTNFRSCREIIEFNEQLIKDEREIDKNLVPDRDAEGGVYYLINDNENVQAERIANMIQYLLETEKISRYDDVAILLSSINYAKGVKELLESLQAKGIPYNLSENDSLMSNPEVRAMIILLWYMKESDDKIILSRWEKDWLNLKAFSQVQDILDLNPKTCQILSDIEDKYQEEILITEKEVYKQQTGKTSKIKKYSGVFNRDNDIVDEILNRVEHFDLSTKTRKDLEELGIDDEHDLTLFENLYNIKQELYDEETEFYEKPSVLEVYYDLLQYSGILDKRLSDPSEDDERILRNLGQITETIANYEEIVTKYSMNGLLWFIFQEFDNYDTPSLKIDEMNKVQIMTVHKSKGLEFPVVILGSIYEGKFPKYREQCDESIKDYVNGRPTFYTPPEFLQYKREAFSSGNGTLEEKIVKEENRESKRVFYVATTRAEDILVLSSIVDRDGRTPKIIDDITEDDKYLELTDDYSQIKEKSCKSNEYEPERLKLSYTHLSEYNTCSQEYNLRYNYRFKNSKNKALTFGEVAHAILNLIHQKQISYQKEGKGQVTSPREINEMIERVKQFNQNLQNDENDEFMEIEDAIYKYWEENKDKYYIIGSEVPFTIVDNDFDVEGKIDLIVKDKETNDITIIDFKTTSETSSQKLKERYQKQLFLYAMAIKKLPEFKDYNIKEAMIYSVKFSKEIPVPISNVDIDEIRDTINTTVEKIMNEEFKQCADDSKCFNCEYNKSICRRR